LQAEFLQRVREWNRKIQVIERVGMDSAIQRECRGASRQSGNDDTDPALQSAGRRIGAGRNSSSQQRQEIGRIPALKRQVDYLLVLDDLTNSQIASLDHRYIRLNLHLLIHLADFERNSQVWVLVDTEFNSGLHKRAEPRQRRFDFIWTNRKIWQNEVA